MDIADALRLVKVGVFMKYGILALGYYRSVRVTYVYFKKFMHPMNQLFLRRGVSWGTFTQGLLEALLTGNAMLIRGPIPEGMWGFDANAMQYS
ncbi:ABC transporter substrate-binding protein, partial [Enterobacter intestinihominis]